jgi:hypothetical protein
VLRSVAVAIGLAVLAGCAETPRSALSDYRAALAQRDAKAIWERSSAARRAEVSPEDLAAVLGAPETAALVAELAEPQVEKAELILASGRKVVLVREAGRWRIAEGGADRLVAATPVGAVLGFFAAVAANDLPAIRSRIPNAAAARFTDDAALVAHLERIKPRIEAAKNELAPLGAKQAWIEGDRAEIAYGSSKAVRLVREDGRWRIVDLE